MNIVMSDVKTITFLYTRTNILTNPYINWYSFVMCSDCQVWIITVQFGIYDHTLLTWNAIWINGIVQLI